MTEDNQKKFRIFLKSKKLTEKFTKLFYKRRPPKRSSRSWQDRYPFEHYLEYSRVDDVILGAFVWKRSKDRVKYWSEINEEWRNLNR